MFDLENPYEVSKSKYTMLIINCTTNCKPTCNIAKATNKTNLWKNIHQGIIDTIILKKTSASSRFTQAADHQVLEKQANRSITLQGNIFPHFFPLKICYWSLSEPEHIILSLWTALHELFCSFLLSKIQNNVEISFLKQPDNLGPTIFQILYRLFCNRYSALRTWGSGFSLPFSLSSSIFLVI